MEFADIKTSSLLFSTLPPKTNMSALNDAAGVFELRYFPLLARVREQLTALTRRTPNPDSSLK